ncbi:flagellin, partial [Arsukibacterium sp.]|uniref:flagellin n=1 Tax=Arsukibacterium sp. TaxID=1977258 RepID=UPI002FDB6BD5
IANRLDSSTAGKAQGERNLYDGISLARVYEQGLQGINDNLGELNRLAVAAGNGLYSSADRQALQSEADGFIANIQQSLSSSDFAGKKLFDNARLDFSSGNGVLSIDTADVGATLSSQNLFSLDLSSASAAAASQGVIREAQEYIGSLQAQTGASINSFNSAARNSGTQQVAQSEARSRITDLDFAKATSQKVAADILSNTSVSVAIQARVQQQQALSLFGG